MTEHDARTIVAGGEPERRPLAEALSHPAEQAEARLVALEAAEIDDKPAEVALHRRVLSDHVRFILAGHATFTLVSMRTGQRFTYKVSVPREPRPGESVHFVAVLAGPDNTADYTYMGAIFGGPAPMRLGRKSRVGPDAPSFKAFDYVWNQHLALGKPLPAGVEFWHAGRCGRCGRKLTVPSSIESGYGPECVTKVGVAS